MEGVQEEVKQIKITLGDYHYSCSDGCCDMYGTNITVDGVKLYADGSTNYSALLAVLEHLGYEVEIQQIDEQ